MTIRLIHNLRSSISFVVCAFLMTGSASATAQMLSGQVTNEEGEPFVNVAVDVLDATGGLVDGAVFTNENGDWVKNVPSPGTYFVRTVGSWTPGYQGEIWSDIPCDNCDPLTTGTPIEVPDIGLDGIDFVLSRLPGYPCSIDEVILRDTFEEVAGDFSCKLLSVNTGEGGFISYGSGRQCFEAEDCLLASDRLGSGDVLFNAQPRSGYLFTGWQTGADNLCVGQPNPCQLKVSELGEPPDEEWRLSPAFVPEGNLYFPPVGHLSVCSYVEPTLNFALECEIKDFEDYGYGPLSQYVVTSDQFFIDYEVRKDELEALPENERKVMCNADRFDGVFEYADYTPLLPIDPEEEINPPPPGIFEPLVFGRVQYTLLDNEDAGRMIHRALLKWADNEVDLSWDLGSPGPAGTAHFQTGLNMIVYVMAWDAVRNASFVTVEDREKIDKYLHRLMRFLSQKNGHEWGDEVGTSFYCDDPCLWANNEVHNHAWTQDLGLMAYSVMTKNDTLFQRGIGRFFSILDGLIRPDGSIFMDSQRGGSSLAYSIGYTDQMIRMAELAAVQGYDLYEIEVDGVSLHKIIEFHVATLEDESLMHPYSQTVLTRPHNCENQSCLETWNNLFWSETNPDGYRGESGWTEMEIYRRRFPASPLVSQYLSLFPEDEIATNNAEGPFSQVCEFRQLP